MSCRRLTLANGMTAIVCGAPARRPKACHECGADAQFLCDWKVGRRMRCDRPICAKDAHEVAPNKHLCPTHQAAYRQWLASRSQRALQLEETQ